MIYNRLYAWLDQYQYRIQKTIPDDRSSCDVQARSLKGREWRTDMWVAAIDFKKAHSMQYNMKQSGDLSETVLSVNNTFTS